MQKVCEVNRIKDPAFIVVGQRIFIPGAEAVRTVRPAPTVAFSGSGGSEQEATSSGTDGKPGSPGNEVAAIGGGGGPRATAPYGGPQFIWPVKGPVTSWFGPRRGRSHDGIDITAPKGTPVLAAERGKVIYSDNGVQGYGNLIIIQHAGGFHTVYGHNSRNRVDVDEQVHKAQVIAEVGNSGNASGPHLHFEVRRNERAVDPMDYLP
jgi:murein DD-endopeptidase MepM/ murein hydrolase activator NlpD